MSWTEIANKELLQARRELAAAEDGLKAGTLAAQGRYARALHEAEVAEQRANRASRHSQRRTWN